MWGKKHLPKGIPVAHFMSHFLVQSFLRMPGEKKNQDVREVLGPISRFYNI